MATVETVPPDFEAMWAYTRWMCLAGRTDEQILAVAQSTRWRSRRSDIKALLVRRGAHWRKHKGEE